MGAARLDSLGMFEAAAGLPEQCREAVSAAMEAGPLPLLEDVESVVVLGMGGSGIAGDILMATAAPFMPVPAAVIKTYVSPAFVGRGTLAFAVSFSGETEETLEAAEEAVNAGASLVAVTSGGSLAKLAADSGSPVVPVPREIPAPRAAVGALAVPPLLLLERIGLFPGARGWVDMAIEQLRRRRDQLTASGSPAAALAHRIGRTFPLVCSSRALGAAAALRWKTQVNENAKSPAFWSLYPELCHNEVVGWGQHGDITRQLFTMVNLRFEAEHPQTARRFEIVRDIASEVVARIEDVRAEGEGDLAQLMDLVIFGDFVSLHLAAQEGIDPGPAPVLDEIKEALRRG
jgi:glucose/mannose-6-phosphate isomerase